MKKIEVIINDLAYENVSRDVYQVDDLDTMIQTKLEEKKQYLSGEREQPKFKHLLIVQAFDDDVESLKAQRNATIKAVDDKFSTDIELYKTLESTKWAALAIAADEELRNSEWMMMSDSTLTTEQKTTAKAYRKSLMDLNKDHETADEAIVAFETIEANKPDWALW